MHRSIGRTQRGLNRTTADFAHLPHQQGVRLGQRQLGMKKRIRSEELELVDGLSGMTGPQLRRTVRGQDNQRQAGLARLDDSRVIMCPCRSRGTDYRHRLARRLDPPKGMKGGGSLIE